MSELLWPLAFAFAALLAWDAHRREVSARISRASAEIARSDAAQSTYTDVMAEVDKRVADVVGALAADIRERVSKLELSRIGGQR